MILSFSYSSTANAALSAITANTIQGTNPYLELNGVKAVDLSSLLSIKVGSDTYISDASGNMKKDNGNGTYTAVSLITLPNAGDTFASVKTLAPADTTLNGLNDPNIIPVASYKDDDGDGTFTVTGNLKGVWTDKNGAAIADDGHGKSDLTGLLNTCLAPYTLTLTTSGNPEISTLYGDPNKTTYSNNNVKFTINPATQPDICHATPGSMGTYANAPYAGPADMWDTTKGFKVQSSYEKNFPTTGSNGLYFTLDVGGVDATTLKWGDAPSPGASGKVVVNGITAMMVPTSSSEVKVTLTGPTAASPDAFTNPTEIVLKGHNSGGSVVVDYGFNLTTWYINRGSTLASASAQTTWCSGLNGANYKIIQVKDVTNASGGTWTGATPGSGGNYYQRRIGGGLFSEWGSVGSYTGSDWTSSHYWTSDTGAFQFRVFGGSGYVHSSIASGGIYGACRSQ